MTRPPAPYRLIYAMDVALDEGGRLPDDVICGVHEWLHQVLAGDLGKPVTLESSEIILIAHALGDAIRAPIRQIPEMLPEDLETALRNYGFLEARCCGALAGMVNPNHVDVGDVTSFPCNTCGSLFVVAFVDDKKTLVRKEDA